MSLAYSKIDFNRRLEDVGGSRLAMSLFSRECVNETASTDMLAQKSDSRCSSRSVQGEDTTGRLFGARHRQQR